MIYVFSKQTILLNTIWFTPDNLNLASNKDDKHYCFPNITATNFTHLMKLVLLTQESPEAFEMLKQVLKTINTEDLNAKNLRGLTALMLASENRNTKSTIETVKLLIEAGANLDTQDIDGWTTLMLASKYSNAKTVKLLVNTDANVDIQDDHGSTALICAAINSNAKIVKLLINSGANLNMQNNNGRTALMYVSCNLSYERNIETVKLLIEAGANPMIKTKDNKTVCDVVAGKGIEYFPVLKLLCEAELRYMLTH